MSGVNADEPHLLIVPHFLQERPLIRTGCPSNQSALGTALRVTMQPRIVV